jgi:hypothetical protein
MDNCEGCGEAVYFGSCSMWGKGEGKGPWVMADLGDGLWAGDTSPYLANQSLRFRYVTGMVKGDASGSTYPNGHWTIKAGDAQAGTLTTMFDGPRPDARYIPMRKEGAIILGNPGDNGATGMGNFFEGIMTAHYSSDAADDAVQAGITATYGP